MVRFATAAIVVPLLSGCAGIGPTADRPCYVAPGSWNAEDQNIFMRMEVLNVGRYCGVSVSIDRRPGEATGSILTQPEHGRARVRRNNLGVAVAEYFPQRGFVGSDSYRATLGRGQVITVEVRVTAPPT